MLDTDMDLLDNNKPKSFKILEIFGDKKTKDHQLRIIEAEKVMIDTKKESKEIIKDLKK